MQSPDTSSSALDHHSFISNLRAPGRLPGLPPLQMGHPSVPDMGESEYVPIMSPRRRRSGRPAGLLADRLASLRSERLSRTLTNPLRRHRFSSSRADDQIPVLARLLSAAAVATAASLMEEDPAAASTASGLGAGDDVSLESFLESLQDGRMATAIQRHAAAREMNGEANALHGLNFVRLFRFGSPTPVGQNPDGQGGENSEGQSAGGSGNPSEERMVPIIIVGIRSVNTNPNSLDDNMVPSLMDAITGIPAPAETLAETTSRTPPNGTRAHQRTSSLDEIESNHRLGRLSESPRPFSAAASETSFGPRPPPSTPASAGLSAFSSGATTPTHAAHLGSQSSVPSRRSSIHRGLGAGLEPPLEESMPRRTARNRRLSESDSARFGAGSSRRNGVVEPDDDNGSSRSWIIYVLGGSYPETHPLLNTPSLFTDSPTYEDMVLLSSLLGPAKPPVASEADIASAPGLYAISVSDSSGSLIARQIDGDGEPMPLNPGERCLVCLSDFEVMEEARKLVQCGHMFHRICIEQVSNRRALSISANNLQWLTTGRNSCPLCRREGVQKTTESAEQEHAPSPEMLQASA